MSQPKTVQPRQNLGERLERRGRDQHAEQGERRAGRAEAERQDGRADGQHGTELPCPLFPRSPSPRRLARERSSAVAGAGRIPAGGHFAGNGDVSISGRDSRSAGLITAVRSRTRTGQPAGARGGPAADTVVCRRLTPETLRLPPRGLGAPGDGDVVVLAHSGCPQRHPVQNAASWRPPGRADCAPRTRWDSFIAETVPHSRVPQGRRWRSCSSSVGPCSIACVAGRVTLASCSPRSRCWSRSQPLRRP